MPFDHKGNDHRDRMPPFSILMSIYAGEQPSSFAECLESLRGETPADQVVVVEDGPIPHDLNRLLESFSEFLPVERVPMGRHAGLGLALASGVIACRNDLICRMDADDLVVPGRFAAQVARLAAEPALDILGGQIEEFDSASKRVVGRRTVPVSGTAIRKLALFRNPMNHMSVAFRKRAILEIGNYRHAPGMEDYDLWVRALAAGKRLENMPEVLVRARTTPAFYRRRSGVGYVRSEWRMARVKLASNLWPGIAVLLVTLARMVSRLLPAAAVKRIYGVLRS